MIISKTPYRISFFGGGTDYPGWYLKEGGVVLSTTIDKYCYISCRVLSPFFDLKHRIVWSHIENVSSISEILHPAIREGLRYLGFDDHTGLEIHHQGDLPARAGMGSSSAFVVGLIKALMAVKGEIIDRHELAIKAIELEQDVLKENVGSQDQIASSYGGFNMISFSTGGKIQVDPVMVSPDRIRELEEHLMLFYTGSTRFTSEINCDLIKNILDKKQKLYDMKDLVEEALSILVKGTGLDEFGKLLHKTWELKRSISNKISNFTIDKIYRTAMNNGAIGGKLLGAGGSGFMLFFVPLKKQKHVREALSNYLHVPFKSENEGSAIIFYRSANETILQNKAGIEHSSEI
jgi:D-glycero-alpha-D-manno-heptose-7-phosphate kinase